MPISEENAERCLQLLQDYRASTHNQYSQQLQGEVNKSFNILTSCIRNLVPSGGTGGTQNGPIQDSRDKEEILVLTFQNPPKSVLEFGVQVSQSGNRGGSFTSQGVVPSNLAAKRSIGNIKISVVVPNGYAHRDGKLKNGDELLEINSYLMERCSVERARYVLKFCDFYRDFFSVNIEYY